MSKQLNSSFPWRYFLAFEVVILVEFILILIFTEVRLYNFHISQQDYQKSDFILLSSD